MRLVVAKVDDGSLENWRRRISITPVLKSFRVRPVDISFDGEVCTVSVMDLKDSRTFGWDLFNTDQLISQLLDIGIDVARVDTAKTSYGFDVTFRYRVSV